jgi:hypothetical protein
VSTLIRKPLNAAWGQWEHRNGILLEREAAQHHNILAQDTTDRRIRRHFAMGVEGLRRTTPRPLPPPGTLEDLRKQWLASVRVARARQSRRAAGQAEKYPKQGTSIHGKLASRRDWVILCILESACRQLVIDGELFHPLCAALGTRGRL